MLSMKAVALTVVVWLAAGSFAFADVRLSFSDGHVSIVAKDATVGQILTEWAKIGQTKVVNVERMPRAPLSIELENVSEERALEVMFRELSGYMAAPRAIAIPNASRFDRIIVVPASSARPGSAAPPAAKVSASVYQAPAPPQQPSAYQAPASPQQSSAYQASASPQQPAAFEPPPPADDTANDAGDEPASATVGVAISTQPSGGPVGNTQRQALETVDPRTFRLETLQPQGGLPMVPPSGAGMLRGGGVATPGMIVKPITPPR